MKRNNLKAALIGKDGRSSAIERSLLESPRLSGPVLRFTEWKGEPARHNILRRASEERPDFVIVGPEEPLAAGIVDASQKIGIACVGPTQSLARLESSKAFTRELLSRNQIPGNPRFKSFASTEGIAEYLRELGEYVIKPDGLTGGKGVKISGAHLFSTDEAVRYSEELFQNGHPAVVIEEKLDGEEFSLQSFCDGTAVIDMVVVQDHKRALEDDTGPNTGGMGSYSCADHRLPFLLPQHVQAASAINAAMPKALLKETGHKYKGILYGGFMATRDGIRLLEYNARFGDPETMNVLPLLETDFVDICDHRGEARHDAHPLSEQGNRLQVLGSAGLPGKPDQGRTNRFEPTAEGIRESPSVPCRRRGARRPTLYDRFPSAGPCWHRRYFGRGGKDCGASSECRARPGVAPPGYWHSRTDRETHSTYETAGHG